SATRSSGTAMADNASLISPRGIGPAALAPRTIGRHLELSSGGSMGVPMTVVPLRAEVTSDHVGRAGETMDGEAHAPTEARHLDKTVGGTAPKRTSARPESRDGGVSHMSLGAKLALMVAIFLAVP